MKSLVRISVIGVLLLLVCNLAYGQKNPVITLNNFSDSTTFVNIEYDITKPQNIYTLSLKFDATSRGAFDFVRVVWTASDTSDIRSLATSDTLNHAYTVDGCYQIQFLLYQKRPGETTGEDVKKRDPDMIYYAWALNKPLEVSFEIESVGNDKSQGCLSYGADTLLVRFTQNDNPPLTFYSIHVSSMVPLIHEGASSMLGDCVLEVLDPSLIDLGNNWVQACWANQEAGRRDSIWLIFTEATGVKGANVSVKMSCQYKNDQGRDKYINKETSHKETVWIFDKPDLRQIYRNGALPFPDTLFAFSLDKQNFNVCAPGSPQEIKFMEPWFYKYQTIVLGEDVPERFDTTSFKVQYYYTDDSVSNEDILLPGVTWHEVTGNPEYVDDTTLTFRRAGFYMMRMELANKCSEPGEVDTLWTSLVRKDNTKDEFYDDHFRYIQVYENLEANLAYQGEDVFCLNTRDSVILVDRNRRKFYDVPPVYSLTIIDEDTDVVISEKEALDLAETNIYKGDVILNTGLDAGDYSKVEHAGCDSTTIKLLFNKPGNYRVIWGRKGENCEEVREKEFVFHIGDVPEILNDTISKYCFANGLALADGKLFHCGPYEFEIPDLSPAFEDHNRAIDSVRFQFTRGDHDSLLTYTGNAPTATFTFDSAGNKLNYILVNIYNGCGVSKSDSVGFFTPVKPDSLAIWRDSFPDNDTLCLNAEYNYYVHGVLPENHLDSVTFSGNADINGVAIAGGTGKYVGLVKDQIYGVIRHKQLGQVIETYRIQNKDFPKCNTRLQDTIWVVAAPDTIIYKKEILYCESMDTLNTQILFHGGDTIFNRASWQWTNGIAEGGKFPKFLFRDGQNDTLYAATIQSAGCYHRDTIVFKPQVLPEANLNLIEELCVPDTLNSIKFRNFAAAGNLNLPTMQWSVYKNTKDDSSLVYVNAAPTGKIILTEHSADSIGLIYVMQNDFNPRYYDFSGKDFCWRSDTLPVRIYKPRLTILKNDTLSSGAGGVYDFADIQNNHLFKKDLSTDPLVWTAGFVNDGSFDGNVPPKYTLGPNDKDRDSLQFVLSGKTYCGDEISDTLIVCIPRTRLYAHRDTICSNTVDYRLWGRTTGEFVDTSSLEWRIINPAGTDWGSLSPVPAIGSAVVYIPGAGVQLGDIVKIEVKGSYAGGIPQADTVLLWVNPAPKYTPLAAGDTLLSIDQIININRIKALDYKNVSGLSARVSGWARVEHDTNIIFTNSAGDEKNNKITGQIILKGLPGCANVTTAQLPMMDLVNPAFKFIQEPIDMCAGEEYGTDTLSVFKGDRRDRFTVLKWTIVSGGGRFGKNGNDTVSYIAGMTGGIGIEKIKLEADKQFRAYDGTWQSSLRGTPISRNLSVNVHVEPSLGLKNHKDRDTLCREENQIEITYGAAGAGAPYWVLVSPAFYGDSLRFNGIKLTDNKYTFRKNAGETDSVLITVGQGRCTQWAGTHEEIYLYKMDEILRTKLTNVKVCEGGEVTIHYPVALTQKYYWTWNTTNGVLDTLGKELSPVYRPVTANQGKVQLHVIPHEGCQEEMTFSKIDVSLRPWIELEDQMICKKEGNVLNIPIRFIQGSSNDILGIDWYRKGEASVLGQSAPADTEFRYTLDASDITYDSIYFVAKVFPKTPCENAYTYDTIKVLLKGQPVITVSASEICQAGEMELLKASGDLGWLKIENAVNVVWENNGFGSFNGDSTKYLPGEHAGRADLRVIAKGVVGCADQNLSIHPEVKAAPIPDFSVISATSCQKAQTQLEADAVSGITVAQWDWTIEGQSYISVTDRKVAHEFQNAGEVDVYLKQTYSYSGSGLRCWREKTEAVTIYPKPHADFENITQVAKGKPVVIHNLSTPAEVLTPDRSKWELEGEIHPISGPDLNYQFNFPGNVQMTLTVTTAAGCIDSKSGVLQVVEPPVADFDVEVDSCGNTATFILNTAGLNQSEIWWNWGKGSGFEQDVRTDLTLPMAAAYDVAYKDTVYRVVLELRNAADTVQKEIDIRFISRLQAGFEILPETSGCREIYRKIALNIKGKADESYVDWGDGDALLYFEGGEVTMLSHRFENTTPLPVIDTIRLEAKNGCFTAGDKHPIKILPVTVSVEPAIVGNPSPCYGLDDELKIRNASIGFDKSDCQWAWKFEKDNDAYSQTNVDTARYSYEAPGKYKVTLWMKDRCNEDTASLWVDVRGNDSLYFDILSRPYCTDQTVTLKFTQKGMPEFSDLRWTIYEAHTGQSLKAVADSTQLTYKFTRAGDYGVLLSGKAEGCEDRQILPLHINETPQAMISLINGSSDTGCEPFTVEFQAADGSDLNKMPRISWDFKNEVISSELKEKVVFKTEGTYDVTLTLTSDSGCISKDHQAITVLHTPRISFVTNDSLFCTRDGNFEVIVSNTSEDLNTCRFEWFKKIGTGISESIANTPQLPSLNFEGVSGPIELKLIATYLQTGCKQSYEKKLVASEAVKAHIFKDVPNVCLDYPVYFASRSGNATKVRWEMGDGNITVDTAFEYSYDKVGDYNIKLVVENEDGCKDSVPMSFTVYPLPVADFVWKKNNAVPDGYPDSLDLPKVDNGGVDFTNYSTVNPDDWGTELHYRWNFGDSTEMNTAKNPSHRFNNNGLYEVWLKVITEYGCVDSMSSQIPIDAVKGLYLPTAFAPAMPDEELGDGNDYRGSARFQPKGIGLYSYKIQIFDSWSGTCVWSSEALRDGQPAEYWDGKFNGADLPAGNYIWKVKAIFIDGTVWQNEKGKTEGTLILIR